jgi:hypothetical protein
MFPLYFIFGIILTGIIINKIIERSKAASKEKKIIITIVLIAISTGIVAFMLIFYNLFS